MSITAKNLTSNGIPVKFPFDPYPSQLNYIEKVTSALLNGTNALLESPTGTGKTLCLLCGSLAWHTYNKSRLPKAPAAVIPLQYEGSDGPTAPVTLPGAVARGIAKPSVIIYASRTHAQLAQVVSELRASGYTPRMSVLGSREQLCIHGRISKLRGSALNHACNSASASRACTYKNNLESYKGGSEGVGDAPSPILDIEQLNELGRKDQICPYFFSRDNSTNADIVLLPYNYLVDSSIRGTLKINWDNSIVIFDEAHNLESVATDATSFSLSSTDIAACISELQDVVRLLQAETLEKAASGSGSSSKPDSFGNGPAAPNLDRCLQVLKSMFELERRLDNIHLSQVPNMGTSVGKVFPGRWLLEVMEQCGFRVEQAGMHAEEIIRSANYLMDDLSKVLGEASGRAAEPKLAIFAKAFSKIYRGKSRVECFDNASFYKVFLSEEQQKRPSYPKNASPNVSASIMTGKKRVLNYWCFSTGLAVEEIKKLGVRSIILTSGTLSPMASFKEDLRVPFPIELENPHVIREKEQIWVGALSTGPSGKELNSSFAQRDLSHVKDELGNTILMICQTMIGQRPMVGSSLMIPPGPELKGGVLVFFPSYGALESCRKHWVDSGLWARLKAVMGNVVVESKGGGGNVLSANKVGGAYNARSSGSVEKDDYFGGGGAKPDENTPESAIVEFENAIQASGGKCVLMAVCRGKMSEGIDFRDKKGRVVIITGIPYAPHVDPWVVLKREYLDSRLSGKLTSNNDIATPLMTASSGGIAKAGPLILGSSHPYGKPAGTSSIYSSVTSQQITASTNSAQPISAPIGAVNGCISGQTWYDQSAMRAVNQALGRVIRHKNDWGVIFFLDSRFQQPNRISQLSKWVRPTVKKYIQLTPALNEFRAFITKAMQDPILSPVVRVNLPERSLSIPKFVPHPSMVPSDINTENSSNPSRAVTVSASALGAGIGNGMSAGGFGLDGIDFIDPSYLMTQQEDDVKSIRSNVEDAFGLTTSKQSFGGSSYSQQFSQSTDYQSFFKKAKQASFKGGVSISEPPQKKSLSSALGGRSSGSSVGSKMSMKEGWEDKKKTSQALMSSFSSSKAALSTLFGFDKPPPSFTSLTSDVHIGLTDEEEGATLSTADTINQTASGGRYEFLKALTAHLKTKIPDDSLSKFKQDIAKIIQNPKALESVVAIRQFVDAIYNILSVHLRGSSLLGVMTRLVPLIPERHINVYNATSRKLCQSQLIASVTLDSESNTHADISSQSSFPETEDPPIYRRYETKAAAVSALMGKPFPSGAVGSDFRSAGSTTSSTIKDLDNVYKRAHSEVERDVIDCSQSLEAPLSQSVMGASSKRARSMALTAESKTARVNKHSLLTSAHQSMKSSNPTKSGAKTLSLFEKLGQITASGGRVPLSSNSSGANGAQKAQTQLICTVCNEKVSDPYAARCGHICCIRCWKSWLKDSSKQSCPLCRKEIQYSQLTKLIIRSD